MRIPPRVVKLEQIAAMVAHRLPGYFEECQRRGQFDPVNKTLTFTEQDFQEIRVMFNPKTPIHILKPGCCGQ